MNTPGFDQLTDEDYPSLSGALKLVEQEHLKALRTAVDYVVSVDRSQESVSSVSATLTITGKEKQ